MPIFEYRCKSCGHKFEELRMSSDKDEDLACPKCGKPRVEKVLSVFSSSGGSSGGGGSCNHSGPVG